VPGLQPPQPETASRGWEVRLRTARALLASRRVGEAAAAFAGAVTEGMPLTTAAADHWRCHMLLGQFEAAWQISDAVLAVRSAADFDRSDQPLHLRAVWRGNSLEGSRLLIRCYHGLGDTIQFCRYIPILATRCRSVFVEAQTELMPLLSRLDGLSGIVPLGSADGLPVDAAVESMEIPHAVRTRLLTVPGRVPYLNVAPLGGGFSGATTFLNVGIVWQGGDWDRRRSLSTADLQELLRIPDVQFHSLQLGPAGKALRSRSNVIDRSSCDIVEAARIVATLDLVITIDTLMAHLAGALGVPTWLLLHFDADWRWLHEGARSPWYPTATLFRQTQPSLWADPLRDVAGRLRTAVSDRKVLWPQSVNSS
jgi:hypothetical protein